MRNIHYIGNTKIVYSAFPDKMKAIFEGLEILPLFRMDSYYNLFGSKMENMLRRILFVVLLLAGTTIEASAQNAKLLNKQLAKQGWMVEPGTKSIAEQLKEVDLAEQDTTVIVARGHYEADTYHEAFYKAYVKALHDGARNVKAAKTVVCVEHASNKEKSHSGASEVNKSSESTEFSISIKQEVSDSVSYNKDTFFHDKWSTSSKVLVYGESRMLTPYDTYQSRTYAHMKIEDIQIIQSMYRRNQDGKIEVALSLKIPRLSSL